MRQCTLSQLVVSDWPLKLMINKTLELIRTNNGNAPNTDNNNNIDYCFCLIIFRSG
ncbi:hypothetical protein THF1C08_10473 [Vibrio jasicida]|uniref:Uncharacterized protein n=1 Tax=Vibrio jasicida TaxID=766224 RepID=A0AAU9QEZ1_9VIBR|nr:hypothetical protein THF1C08_10473 [Vibrio jasicida]CAH1566364.1 hypothetical protein THF1A12_10474 [Vibrio jasicida]